MCVFLIMFYIVKWVYLQFIIIIIIMYYKEIKVKGFVIVPIFSYVVCWN